MLGRTASWIISGKRVTKSIRTAIRVAYLRWYSSVVAVPGDLKYTKSHEWVRVDGDVATIGITDHAQSELGDVVFVDLPTPGRMLSAGDSFGTVESVKTVSDLYSPVGGEVTEVNETLGARPEQVNEAPYEGGWLVRVRMADDGELGGLMDANAYESTLEG
ncbi:MAG: glycine cleavage system protein GcvH [Fimbriimonadaceae bacterium]|nr:glycine cleavage system protein GcvH [Fimbriimonadaceae bacterium]